MNTPPVLLQPRCSSSAVVAAGFHPEQQNIFILAFADGALAIYDALKILRRNGRMRDSAASPAGSSGEIAAIKGLHTSTTEPRSDDSVAPDGIDPGTGKVTVTANAAGIASVALLPGYQATAVTVGSDGKCCVTDFTQPYKDRAVLMKSWHLRRPATCVSVIYAKERPEACQLDRVENWMAPSTKDYCIAIGRQDGKVLLFDLEGNPLGQRILETHRTRIIDLEWAKTIPDAHVPVRKDSKWAFELGGEALKKGSEEVEAKKLRRRGITAPLEQDALFDFTTPRKSIGRVPIMAPTFTAEPLPPARKTSSPVLELDLTGSPFLEIDSIANAASAPPVPPRPLSKRLRRRSSSTVAPQSEAEPRSSDSGAIFSSLPSISQSQSSATPPIPPRPTIKTGGRLYMRRVQRARDASTNRNNENIPSASRRSSGTNDRSHRKVSTVNDENTPAPSRRISGSITHPHGRVSSTIPPRPKVLKGPRPLRKRSPTASLQAKVASARASDSSQLSSNNVLSPLSNGSFGTPQTWRTASSQFRSSEISEASNDTVVDWSPGILNQSAVATGMQDPTPMVEPTAVLTKLTKGKGKEIQTPKKRKEKKKKKKGHISLSSQASNNSSASTDTICDFPKYRHPTVDDATPSILPPSAAAEAGGKDEEWEEHPEFMDSATALVLASGEYSTPQKKPARLLQDTQPTSSTPVFVTPASAPPPPQPSRSSSSRLAITPTLVVGAGEVGESGKGDQVGHLDSTASVITKESQHHHGSCNCEADIRGFLEGAFKELRVREEERARGLVEEVRMLFEEQKRWVLVEIGGMDGSGEEEAE